MDLVTATSLRLLLYTRGSPPFLSAYPTTFRVPPGYLSHQIHTLSHLKLILNFYLSLKYFFHGWQPQ